MDQTMPYLNDEHMQLYEWSGAGAGITLAGMPKAAQGARDWHPLYGILALLTTLLALNGCDSPGPAELASEQVEQAIKEMQEAQTHQPMKTGTVDEYGSTLEVPHKQVSGALFRPGAGIFRQ
ncbi:hypothetical protein [Thiobacillus sp.]